VCFVLIAYAVPAVAAWTLIGLAVTALPVATVARAAVIGYGCVYGTSESLGLSRPAAPGRRWQVPQELMITASPRRRVLVWGAILGPGFLTRNPYAGFAVLPLLVAGSDGVAAGVLLAALIGAGHGGGRALALLGAVARPPQDPMLLLMRSLRWRVLDGLMLAAIAGAVLGAVGERLG
jgi:hypothetical protein